MSHGKLNESFEYHLRALQQYKSTIGNNHHRTGDLCVKVSDHYIRLGQHDTAMYVDSLYLFIGRNLFNSDLPLPHDGNPGEMLTFNDALSRTLLDQALKIYGDREYYGPEKARALYKKANLLTAIGDKDNGSTYLDESRVLYRELAKKNVDQPSDVDFDELIVFWSK